MEEVTIGTMDGAGKIELEPDVKKLLGKYFRGLQKKSSEARKKRDPNTYKKMANLRWEKREDLKIIME